MLTMFDVYISAEKKVSGGVDWYGILGVIPLADEGTVKKQCRELALMLYPNKNKSTGADDLSTPLSRVFETFQAMGFLAPLAPRALPDPVPPQFRLDLYCTYHQSAGHHTDCCTALRHAIQDIIDSRMFGHPQSDMSSIPTSAQATHADAPPPAVPDLIDLGD
ncbi:hypothetical protein VitviT2T_021434 [Vitis vinifera]|uniref:J domain-containing protein n=1 Tax=Vitis vinifera TaxID=29760 RepID=A0ABY9D6Z6_VITVI|nr:hypothetical protein VitviT2T_021434 [Vitis vinifera]